MSWGRKQSLDPTKDLMAEVLPPSPWSVVTCQSFHRPEPAPASGKVWEVPDLGSLGLDFTSIFLSSLLARSLGFPKPAEAERPFLDETRVGLGTGRSWRWLPSGWASAAAGQMWPESGKSGARSEWLRLWL